METRTEKIARISEIARRCRIHSLDMALNAGSNGAHLGPGYSEMDIMATLYFEVMRHDPKNPEWPDRDRFVLSKGHGVLGYYTMLAESGYFPVEELPSFETNDSFLAGHPSRDIAHGIEATSGSLGMGISIAVGMALAAKRDGKKHRVYCLVGDGECDEGIVWEAVLCASQYCLDNLCVIVDHNRLQSDGLSRDIIFMGDMDKKFAAFGFETLTIDGHDIGQILDALHERSRPVGKPLAVIANTIKGKGVSFMENNNDWHHHKLTAELYDAAKRELTWGGGSDD